jgi:hypothetical protein
VLIDTDGRLAAATEPWRDRVHVVVGRVPRPGFENFGGILSRPDGYCAWAGGPDDIGGLTAALGRWAGRSHDAAAPTRSDDAEAPHDAAAPTRSDDAVAPHDAEAPDDAAALAPPSGGLNR